MLRRLGMKERAGSIEEESEEELNFEERGIFVCERDDVGGITNVRPWMREEAESAVSAFAAFASFRFFYLIFFSSSY